MLSDRKRLILKAVVEYYSKEAQPIGSKLLTQLPYLNFSSATIRYDMLQLEQKGYLLKNHKSSGRIPSLKGYVFYLQNLMTIQQEKLPIISLFEKIINEKHLHKEQIIKRILKILSNFTNCVTISVGSNILKISRIDLICINSEQLILLIVIDQGSLEYRNVILKKDENLEITNLKKMICFLNNLLVGEFLHKALEIIKSYEIQEKIKQFIKNGEKLVAIIIAILKNLINDNSNIYGVTKFFQSSFFKDIKTIKEMIQIFDKKELNKIFFDSSAVICQLSNQIRLMKYKTFMIVSVPYYFNENNNTKGFIAILGPMVMKYQEIIPLLEYLSVHFSRL
ncbi:MAG: heat-inducible transcriptional repressor HrcA [Vigna little leaf phytoplasma]|nr:heat-inducible transcriptional repressor HrcA [Vigna little leaf phytoplasma]